MVGILPQSIFTFAIKVFFAGGGLNRVLKKSKIPFKEIC
jgi:hypothetical protein